MVPVPERRSPDELANIVRVPYDRFMRHAVSPLLTRLRRHRGLWHLCVAVLLFKLLTGGMCLADGLSFPPDPGVTVAVAQVDSLQTHDNDGRGCVLGEAGGCHCTCAHSVPLQPASEATRTIVSDGRFTRPLIPLSFKPAPPGSLLRPPIA